MEPVTHLLTGACLARTGFNRKAAYATLTMAVAAEFPDIDTLWSLRGPVEGFQHHRGITHTFLGLPFEAAFLVAAVYGWHRWRVARQGRPASANPGDCMTDRKKAPVESAEAKASVPSGAKAPHSSGPNTYGLKPVPFKAEPAPFTPESVPSTTEPVPFKAEPAPFTPESVPFTPESVPFKAGLNQRLPKAKPLTAAPVRWGALYGMALLALLSHLLLDYTNNYGLRPFYPFNDHWYAASIVFIFDPAIFGLLLVALVAPSLFGLIGSEVGARRQTFKGRGWAIAALVGVVGLWSLRTVEHGRAVDLAMAQSIAAPAETQPADSAPIDGQEPNSSATSATLAAPAPTYLQPLRALASPDPISPFHWSTATDFGPMYQLAEIDTRNGALTPALTTFPKPGREAEVLLAERTRLGRAYLDWSPMPIIDLSKPDSALAASPGGETDDDGLTVVTFRDPRFMGGWMRDMGRSALTGTVSIDKTGHVVRQAMDGRVEKQGLGIRD